MNGRCIAMWSGPRNLSTAMMRAWENRGDCVVVDEPFYAHYLQHTGIDHPMRDDVLASQSTDLTRIIAELTRKPEHGLFYQKHITTHWLPHFPSDWLASIDHVFLIRNPVPVVASYAAKRAFPTEADLGYPQQTTLFGEVLALTGCRPPVIDSRRFLENPRQQLQTLCNTLDIPFDNNMLTWPAGKRASDGVWAAHWYDAVERSTGFAAPSSEQRELDARQQQLADRCRRHYETLLKHAI